MAPARIIMSGPLCVKAATAAEGQTRILSQLAQFAIFEPECGVARNATILTLAVKLAIAVMTKGEARLVPKCKRGPSRSWATRYTQLYPGLSAIRQWRSAPT